MTSPSLSSVIITLQLFRVIFHSQKIYHLFILLIALFKAGSAGSISCRFSTSSSTIPQFLVIFINIILNWMVVDAKAETSFIAPDDLDFFYKSDNARKMLFYFQVSNNNREERHQKSDLMRLPLIIRLSHE